MTTSSAFQIYFTPPVKKQKKTDTGKVEAVPRLVLAPFNTTPEVNFGVIKVNCSQTKPLLIFNPTPVPIKIQFINISWITDRITCSEEIISIAANEQYQVHFTWTPTEEVNLRRVIKVQDTEKSARSFGIVLTGICSKMMKKKAAKGRRLSSKHSSPYVKIQPAKCSRKFNPNVYGHDEVDCFNSTVTFSSEKYVGSVMSSPLRRQTFDIHDKENAGPLFHSNIMKTSSPLVDNNTMTLESFEDEKLPVTPGSSRFPESSFCCDDIDVAPLKQSTLNANKEIKRFFSQLDDINLSTNSHPVIKKFPSESEFSKIYDNASDHKLVINVSKSSSDNFSDSLESNDSPQNTETTYSTAFDSNPFDSCKLIQNTPSLHDKPAVYRIVSSTAKRRRSLKNSSQRNKYACSSLRKLKMTPQSRKKRSLFKRKSSSPKGSSLRVVKTPGTIHKEQMEDPFMKISCYNEEWIEKQEENLIKWMNSLLTPPVEVERDDKRTVNAAQIWVQSSQDVDIKLAPSKEYFASILYHSPQQLDTLRKAASALYASEAVSNVFSKLSAAVDNKVIAVREDRDLHVDQGLRCKLLQLLSCYNSLWLRIGLETIYSQKISVQVKSDVGGLGNFIRKNLFTNANINKKHNHPAVLHMKQPTYKDAMKKFILKKFLMLVYFLDQAKMRKIIRHDPCLFLKNSEFKSSGDLLLGFCSDLVVGRGDVIKHLKYMQYVLQYKQTFLDEYNYSITCLLDLRDGVRITRIFEILLGESELCSQLRVPAVSLLQKVHNVSVAMRALKGRYVIEGDITARDLAMGHREKTLSFLWQIINNYLMPRYNFAAMKIQRWWRIRLLAITIKRLIMSHRSLRELEQATKIIQRKYRSYLLMKRERSNFLQRKNAALKIQRAYRNYRSIKPDRSAFLIMKYSTIVIQRGFRDYRITCLDRQNFLLLRRTVVKLQRRYRALRVTRIFREQFLKLKQATVFIQRMYRASKLMLSDRSNYVSLKQATLCIQRRYKALKSMRKFRETFLKYKIAAVVIQKSYRSYKNMSAERVNYIRLRNCVINIQKRYRATRLARSQRNSFLRLKTSAIIIQRRFKAHLLMIADIHNFVRMRTAVITVQKRYRAIRLMRGYRDQFVTLRNAALVIQKRHRKNVLKKQQIESVRKCREMFLKYKMAAIVIQKWYRSYKKMRIDRVDYVRFRNSVINIQRKYRATRLARSQRSSFLRLKTSAIITQQRFRAHMLMIADKRNFLRMRTAVIIVQRKYRAKRVMREYRDQFVTLRNAALVIQRRYRANVLMKRQMEAAITIQRRYRAQRMAIKERDHYRNFRRSVIFIQTMYRFKLEKRRIEIVRKYLRMKEIRIEHMTKLHKAATLIQAVWRGYKVRSLQKFKISIPCVRTKEKHMIKGTLGYRFKLSVMQLKTSEMYSIILKALWNIESITALSSKLCEELTGEGAIGIILKFMGRANRSVPSIELHKAGLGVMINLARYRKTAPVVWNELLQGGENGIDLIFHVMKIAHDKFSESLFLYGATLVWLLAQDDEVAKQMANIPTVKQQLEIMLKNISRKTKKDHKSDKNGQFILPRAVPNWYVENIDDIFNNHYVGIVSVYKQLFPDCTDILTRY